MTDSQPTPGTERAPRSVPAGAPSQEPGTVGDGSPAKPAAPAVPRPAPRRPRPLPSPLAVIAAALGIFLIALTLMAIQVRQGRDPALGPGPVAAPTTSQPVTGGTKPTKAPAAAKIVTRTSPAAP